MLPRFVLLLLVCCAPQWAGARDTITGVCPDGSIFIVRSSADIPCRDAREVEPQEVPPLKPQFLPRPYAWEVFNQQQDPNNPYNVVEDARRVREAGLEPPGTPRDEAATPPVAAPPPPQAALAARGPAAPDLALAADEIRDLFLIVELAQERAPASFAPEDGAPLRVRLARSEAFGARLRTAGAAAAGTVLLFAVTAEAAGSFHPNWTFVQGHVAYQPDPADPAQQGVVHGAPGALVPEQALLGYVVLPDHLDPAQAMDVYWNDRRISAVLQP